MKHLQPETLPDRAQAQDLAPGPGPCGEATLMIELVTANCDGASIFGKAVHKAVGAAS